MKRLIALDTETTGLDPHSEELFEVAVVDIDTADEKVWHLEPSGLAVRDMHPKAAEVNRYHERTAAEDWWWDDLDKAMDEMHGWLDGAHIVGAVPDFDTRFLTELYRTQGFIPPRWHYHLIDVEALAVGYLHGVSAGPVDLALPWKSDDLSRAVGVEPPSGDDRHTALGDARWARDLYVAITAP